MTETTTPTTHSQSEPLPTDGPEATRELQTKAGDSTDDEITELLAELCDDTLTSAERLENQFSLTSQWSIPDADLMESRILRVVSTDPRTDSSNDESADTSSEEKSIYIVYWLPTEDVAVEQFEKPIPWNPDEYKFARLTEEIGYGPSTLDQVEGEPVVLQRNGNDWCTPDPADAGIHPADYTDTPNEPPQNSATALTNHTLDRIESGIHYGLTHRYTVGAAAFGVGAVIAYTAYIIGGIGISFLVSVPEILTEALLVESGAGGEAADGEETAIDPDVFTNLIETMFFFMIPLILLHFVVVMMKNSFNSGGEY